MPVHLTCSVCEKAFTRTPARVGDFCSAVCFRRSKPPGIITLSEDGATGRVPLYANDGSVRAYAQIDANDIPWASQWRWHLDSVGYAARAGGSIRPGEQVRLHRALMGLERGDIRKIDHIDRDQLNDRRSNLRVGTHQANMQNRRSQRGSSSEYRGVSWNKGRCKWEAYVKIGPKKKNLGLFDNELEAAQAARETRLRTMEWATD